MRNLVLLPFVLSIVACGLIKQEDSDLVAPPIAEQRPQILTQHDHKRVDPYYWLRDDSRTDSDVIGYLNAENAYTDAIMAPAKPLQESLYQEIAGRLVADDQTVPVKRGKHEYYREYQKGGEYPVYLRRKVPNGSPEVLLDVNKLSIGHEYFRVGNWATSYDENLLAYAADNVSRRIYDIKIKDLVTGNDLNDTISGASTSIAWSADGQSIYYVRKDPETLLPFQVYRHRLGTDQNQDELIYEEQDRRFYTRVYNSRSKKFVVISIQSTDSSEIRLMPANDEAEPQLVLAREANHEYRIRHVGNTLYLLTNWQAENFRVMATEDNRLGSKSSWREVLATRDDTLIADLEVFDDHLVVEERFDGLPRIRVIDQNTMTERLIDFPDASYTAWLHANPEVRTDKLRYGYGTLAQPDSVIEHDLNTGESKLLKQDRVLGGFDKANYQVERIKIEARDGTQVPVSLVYRKNLFQRGKQPIYINAYGAYGYSSEPEFSPRRVSLLDRGIVFALVHVRGGSEMGRAWYEAGRLDQKMNTFTDFIDATQSLVDLGYGHKDKVIAAGGSAGGLLMGVVANQAPQLYLAIVAHVPFVDALTTMLDESIPLTTGEFAEWGNPMEKDVYDYILSYSPYDQVKPQNYPNLFVTTGLYDSQVQYFEPAKWVAKLRSVKTDDNLLLLHTDMTTGHGGASGRYERYRTDALEYAFILKLLDY